MGARDVLRKAEQAQAATAALVQEIQALIDSGDQFARHIFTAREEFARHWRAHGKYKGGTAIDDSAARSYEKARELGYPGSREEWSRILTTGL